VNYHPLPCIILSYITFSQILMPASLLLLRVGTIELLVYSGKIFIPDRVKLCQWFLSSKEEKSQCRPTMCFW